jgi:hypothetical protein
MTKAVFRRVVLVMACITIGWFLSCNGSSQDAKIAIQNNFTTDITYIEYNGATGATPIKAGAYAEDEITVGASATGLHKIVLTTGGVGMITIDPVYTEPGGHTKVVLSPSQCTNL